MYLRLQHASLVELFGFCPEPPVLLLAFMEEGSLYDHLHKTVHGFFCMNGDLGIYYIFSSAYNSKLESEQKH